MTYLLWTIFGAFCAIGGIGLFLDEESGIFGKMVAVFGGSWGIICVATMIMNWWCS